MNTKLQGSPVMNIKLQDTPVINTKRKKHKLRTVSYKKLQ